jgi:ectoine hydroxylase-related dioxygenase (phytanoyl-CoA dioxygenase family)
MTQTRSKLETHLHDLEVNGFTVLRDAIKPDFRLNILNRIRELEEQTLPELEEGQSEDDCSFYRTGGLIESDPLFWDIPTDPEVMPIIEGLLGSDFLLSQVSAIDIKPRTENLQPLHPDDALIPLVRPHPTPIGCTAMWCITDFRHETGGTRLLPGSHKLESIGVDWSTDTADEIPGVIQPDVKAGGILIFDHALFHGAASNHSDAWRLGIQCSYHAGWIRPYNNWFHMIPRAEVAKYPERLADLLGYKTFHGAIGTISVPGTNRYATSAFRPPRDALEESFQ